MSYLRDKPIGDRYACTTAVAEASLDTDLFASPGGEAELAIDPVASMEFLVRAVSLKYWSAIRQSDERQNEDVPVLWRSQMSTQQTTLAGRQCRTCRQMKRRQAPESPATINATPTQVD